MTPPKREKKPVDLTSDKEDLMSFYDVDTLDKKEKLEFGYSPSDEEITDIFDEFDLNQEEIKSEINKTKRLAKERRDLELKLANLAEKQKTLTSKLADRRKPKLVKTSSSERRRYQLKNNATVRKKSYVADPSEDLKRLGRCKGTFNKIDREDPAFEGKVSYMVQEVSVLMHDHTRTSLLAALKRALPFELVKEINPNAQLSLDEVIEGLQRYFNGHAKLDNAEAELLKQEFKPNQGFADQIMVFHTKVLEFNDRCSCLGIAFKRRIWSKDRFFQFVQSLFALTSSVKREIIRSKQSYPDIESLFTSQLRILFEDVEEICRTEIKKRETEILLTSTRRRDMGKGTEFYRDPCFRCTGRVRHVKGRKFFCLCDERQKCSICTRCHKIEFHDKAVPLLR